MRKIKNFLKEKFEKLEIVQLVEFYLLVNGLEFNIKNLPMIIDVIRGKNMILEYQLMVFAD